RTARALALGAATRGLAPTPTSTASDADGAGVGSGRWLQIVNLHAVTSSTLTRWGTLATIPRISGRSGSVFDLPMRPSPRARKVPFCFGLAPIADRVWVTRNSDICSLDLGVLDRTALALAVGVQ